MPAPRTPAPCPPEQGDRSAASGASATGGAVRIPESLRHAAARRLVSVPEDERDEAARRLLRSAPGHGIDLSMLFGVLTTDASDVREVCLAVPAAGRTAMLYLSGPARARPDDGGSGSDRSAAVACALGALRDDERVSLAQALPAPEEPWAEPAFVGGGMRAIGGLQYMRAPLPLINEPESPMNWPEGIAVDRLASKRRTLRGEEHADLAAALEASYVDTLDCPELCGLRRMGDVIDSHRSTGVFDPSLWWLVRKAGRPLGCCLLSSVPAQRTLELVYIGLAPEVRGLKIGPALLRHAVRAARRGATGTPASVTCAVDERNAPAQRIYNAMGFQTFASRRALICPV